MLAHLRKVAEQSGENRNLLNGLPDVAPLQTLLDTHRWSMSWHGRGSQI